LVAGGGSYAGGRVLLWGGGRFTGGGNWARDSCTPRPGMVTLCCISKANSRSARRYRSGMSFWSSAGVNRKVPFSARGGSAAEAASGRTNSPKARTPARMQELLRIPLQYPSTERPGQERIGKCYISAAE